MAIHDGHRQRLKNRFIKEGLDNFDDYVVLELLLFYCIPRIDTNEIAHRLIKHFGSFPKVLDAPIEELQKVEGIGSNAAVFLSLLGAVNRYYQTKNVNVSRTLKSTDDFIQYLKPKFLGRRNEMVYLLCLDAKCKELTCKLISEGNVNNTSVSLRKIAEVALGSGATFAVLSHNHPDGVAMASIEDVQTTTQIKEILEKVGVILLDHIVIADRESYSIMYNAHYRH